MERVRTCQLNGHSRSLSFSAIIIVTIIMMVVMIMIVAPCCARCLCFLVLSNTTYLPNQWIAIFVRSDWLP